MIDVELHVDRFRLVFGSLGDDGDFLTFGPALERVAQPQQPRGDDAADRAPSEPVDRALRGVVPLHVVAVDRVVLVHSTDCSDVT